MFPTFTIPPQHAETVGARKARRAEEKETARRTSSAILQSSGATYHAKPHSSQSKAAVKNSFVWFGKSSKEGVQEIPSPPSSKISPLLPREPDSGIEPYSSTASLSPASSQEKHKRTTQLSDYDTVIHAISPDDHYPPPLRALPSRPPYSALPQLPRSRGLLILPSTDAGRQSQYSTVSHCSSHRTTYSNRSEFSNASQYDGALSEESHERTRLSSNVTFEPVGRGSRTGSRQSNNTTKSAQASQAPFPRALAKMKSAGSRIIATRLSEEWEDLDDDGSYQEVVFEKRLWALMAYQRLTQNKQLQSPAHEQLSNSRPADQRRILHLHGSLADGWILATRYPAATVYTLSSMKSSNPPTSYPAPLNHHSLYVPSVSSATPFPDSYFDAIVSRSIGVVLHNDEWPRCFFDCMRVLKPGGQLEILTVDAHMSCEGPKLSLWVDEHLSRRLEAHSLSKQASETVLDTMEIVGLENIRRARIALPAQSPKSVPRPAHPPEHIYGAAVPAPILQDVLDTSRMMSLLGRHFYQDLHSSFLHVQRGEEWFWSRKDIRNECERYNTRIVLTIACATKPKATTPEDGYLDLEV
ncbi:hypothetical protein BDU57DRAFT_522122 [Ampelomyces quisqualis]|uniref:Methyltransferase type 11 domain-containing protein n=1 Tax=Ampelomyces quisqualis TaxID=50730 RepID=A0A6A5QEP3_AMPQU|nr:hypothetical protein BDU57DRAFT_522122 [Ampelomyces quisqualis]